MKVRRLPPRLCKMVVGSTRQNPYVTCPEPALAGSGFCPRHLEEVLAIERELDELDRLFPPAGRKIAEPS